MDESTRRRVLKLCGVSASVGVPGYIGGDNNGNNIQETDGDGAITSEDSAPQGASVQRAEQVEEESSAPTKTPTGTSSGNVVVDSFENGNTSGWNIVQEVSASFQASQERASSGAWSARLSENASDTPIWEYTGNVAKPSRVETAHALEDGELYTDTWTEWFHNDTNVLRVNYNWSNNFLAVNSSGSDPSDNDYVVASLPWPSSQNFFHVVFDNIDWNNHIVGEVKVNGTVEAVDVPFFNNSDGLDRTTVRTGANRGGGVAYIDDTTVPGEFDPTERGTPEEADFSTTPAPEGITTDARTVFDASASTAPNSSITRYEWDFAADGTIDKRGERVTHSFEQVGEIPIELTVITDSGETATTTREITVDLARIHSLVRTSERIDELSVVDLDHTSLVEQRVQELDRAVKNNDISLDAAEEATERLLISEEVTRSVLLGLGPETYDRVQTNYQLARHTAETVLRLLVSLTFVLLSLAASEAGKYIANHIPSASGHINSIISSLENAISRITGFVAAHSPSTKQTLLSNAKYIAQSALEAGVTEVTEIESIIEDGLQEHVEPVAADLRAPIEKYDEAQYLSVSRKWQSIEDGLQRLYDGIDTETIDSSGLEGTLSGASEAVGDGLEQINQLLHIVHTGLESIEDTLDNLALIENINDYRTAVQEDDPLAVLEALWAISSLAGSYVKAVFNAFGTDMGFRAMGELSTINSRMQMGVVGGESPFLL